MNLPSMTHPQASGPPDLVVRIDDHGNYAVVCPQTLNTYCVSSFCVQDGNHYYTSYRRSRSDAFGIALQKAWQASAKEHCHD